MRQVTVNNVTYKSLAAAWEALSPWSVGPELVRKRLSRGWPLEKALMVIPIEPVDRRRSTILTDLDALIEKIQG